MLLKKISEFFKEEITNKKIYISGSAGTGKTYILNNLYNYLSAYTTNLVKLAFTNSAADNIYGKTFHSYFRIDPNNETKSLNKAKSDNLYLIDECSMIHKNLFNLVFTSESDPIIVMFGDFNQLPPIDMSKLSAIEFIDNLQNKEEKIDPKSLYKEYFIFNKRKSFIDTSNFHKIELTKNYRSEENMIKVFTKVLNKEHIPQDFNILYKKIEVIKLIYEEDYVFLSSKYNIINEMIKSMLLHFNIEHITVDNKISDKNKYPYLYFYKGMKCYCVEDPYKNLIMNVESYDSQIIDVRYQSKLFKIHPSSLIPYNFLTIHKSQGREFNNVIVCIDNLFELGHFYTAITRAKKNIILCKLTNDKLIFSKLL